MEALIGINLINLIKAIGYIGIFSIVFAESGLFFGFFLPGDSLLFNAGFLASQNYLSIYWLLIITTVAAITGDSIGYTFGRRMGPKLFYKEDSKIFRKSHLIEAQKFYDRHGGKAIVLARFMPFARTFAPIVAGIANMHYPTFLFYNIIGGIGWSFALNLLGYYLGKSIPNADQYILPIVLLIVFLSILPGIIHLLKKR